MNDLQERQKAIDENMRRIHPDFPADGTDMADLTQHQLKLVVEALDYKYQALRDVMHDSGLGDLYGGTKMYDALQSQKYMEMASILRGYTNRKPVLTTA